MIWHLMAAGGSNRCVFVEEAGKCRQLSFVSELALEELRELPPEVKASMLFSESEMLAALQDRREQKIAFILNAVKNKPYWRETGEDLPFDDDTIWSDIGIPLKWSTILHQLKKRAITKERLDTLSAFFDDEEGEVRWRESEDFQELSKEQARARRYYLHNKVKGLVRVAAAQKTLFLPAGSIEAADKYLLELRDRFGYAIQIEIPQGL